MPQPRILNETQTQPIYSQSLNCTAAIMDGNTHEYDYPWVTIPCDEKLHATYICQPIYQLVFTEQRTPDTRKMKCDNGWLLLKNTIKCFLVLNIGDHEISYYDSEYMCYLRNASLFTVNVYDRVNITHENRDLKSHMLTALTHVTMTHVSTPHVSARNAFSYSISSMLTTSIHDMLFGRQLDQYHVASLLPDFLKNANYLTSEYVNSMVFFASFNRTCVIVEYTTIGHHYASSSYFPKFGVKCRPCYEKIKVSGIICEKPAERHIVICQKDHFECRDKSCILLIYKCDYVVDCFDQSDEDKCSYNVSTKSIDQFVNVPCLPSDDCDIAIRRQIYVHAICDGLYLNDTFLHEKDVCITYDHKMHAPITNRIYKTKLVRSKSHTTLDLFNIFWYERDYRFGKTNNKCPGQFSGKVTFDATFKERQTTINTKLHDICIFDTPSNRRCNSPECRALCSIIFCPGMFKCHDHVCIRLSSVCDTLPDCKRAEDELFCSILLCPGSLKCRGEKRCISIDHICDKYVDCFYSMDDELSCESCPVNCECRGYVITCYSNSNSSDKMIQGRKVMHRKALVIKGTRAILITEELNIIGLIFLNTSNCKLSKIEYSHANTTQQSFIIIADLSKNLLTDSHFLSYHAFRRVVFLDLSFNLLQTVKYRRFLSLKYLTILFLLGNNFKEIKMKVDNYLSFIDLQFIYYIPELTLQIDHDVDFDLVIKTTDSQLCCMFSKHTKCLSSENHISCYAILRTFSKKMVLYCLSFFSLCVSSILLFKQTVQLTSIVNMGENKKHYSIMLMNQFINIILISLYLTSLSVLDIVKINLLYFKISVSCNMLNAVLYISMQTLTVFRSSLAGLITLKIMYPFKHQCTWTKWVAPTSGFVWIFAIMTYILYIILSFQQQNRPLFDKLCSIGWCDTQFNFNMLHIMILVVGNVSILIYILAFIMMYTSLNKHTVKVVTHSPSKHSRAAIVTCKCILANISGILLMVYITAHLFLKFSHLELVNFCLYFFLYALPLDIICFCFAHIFNSM